MGSYNGSTVTRNGKLLNKVIFIAIGTVALLAAILTIISSVRFSNAYNEMFEEELKVAVVHLESEMASVWDGDWGYTDELGLTKGLDDEGNPNSVGEEYTALMDELHKQTGIEYTIFYGKTRRATTLINDQGKRIVGTDASDAVITTVLNGKKTMYAPDLTINNQPYAAYYLPMTNPDGTVVGMVFAGRLRADAISATRGNVITMVVIAVVCIAVIAVAGLFLAQRVSRQMNKVAEGVSVLSSGDLNVKVDESLISRRDELGVISDSLDNLIGELKNVISKSKTMAVQLKDEGKGLADSANQAHEAASSVSQAVDEIAKGSITQSSSIQNAVTSTDNIGRDVDDITTNVNQLDEYAGNMTESCDRAMKAMEELIASNGEVADSVQDIGNTINSTNVSAQEISQFTDAIAGIASQTNLLSLNASIEAARAGEAGRGFAVVADEIRELADQSRSSADKIKAVVDKLLADADASVKVMNTLNSNFSRQGEQLNNTREDMKVMSENVGNVTKSSVAISDRVGNLKSAKGELVGVIEDLSAISEENAAAAQETNASMEELAATFAIINDSAADLLKLASDLEQTISFFKN